MLLLYQEPGAFSSPPQIKFRGQNLRLGTGAQHASFSPVLLLGKGGPKRERRAQETNFCPTREELCPGAMISHLTIWKNGKFHEFFSTLYPIFNFLHSTIVSNERKTLAYPVIGILNKCICWFPLIIWTKCYIIITSTTGNSQNFFWTWERRSVDRLDERAFRR